MTDPLRIAHLLALGVWFGVIATEAVIELLPRRDSSLWQATSQMHYWIDLLVEAPALLAVAGTGLALALSRSADARLVAKVASGSIAVLANGVCIALVVGRDRLRRRGGSPDELCYSSRRVLMAAAVGAPFGLLSLLLGMHLI